MSKVTKAERTAGRPQLTPDRVGDPDVFLGTVRDVSKQTSQFKGEQYAIVFEEMPDYVYRLNTTGLDAICAVIGDETDEWVGERVPLVKTRTSVGGKVHIVFHVAEPAEWPNLLRKQRAKK